MCPVSGRISKWKKGWCQVESKPYQRALTLVQELDKPSVDLPSGIEVAEILKDVHVDEETLVAALLSDHRLLSNFSIAEIEQDYSEPIALLVDNVRYLNSFKPFLTDEIHTDENSERLRRFVLSMVNDIRAMLIRLGFRVARLRLLKKGDDRRLLIARETLDIFAPLANRLGIAQLKWEMEDLSFRYLEPATYKELAKKLEEKRAERESYVVDFIEVLRDVLKAEGLDAEISGRPKHIYSIWKKLQKKDVDIDELYDLRALRVVVADVAECYAVLGLVNTRWKSIKKEFDDYIAHPKPNGYQSLHTVIIGPGKKLIEVQIRSTQMHEFAELGYAAHWRYKEGGAQDDAMQKVILSMRNLMEDSDQGRVFDNFQTELFPDKVFVLTPQGDAIELRKGATPLDFAYQIHTNIGHRTRGAKVDGKIVPLTYELQQHQSVEILTAKEPRPSRDWMNHGAGYLISPRSRSKVRRWFHEQDRDENREAGERILEQTLKRWNLKDEGILQKLTRHFHQSGDTATLIGIGRGEIRQTQLDGYFQPEAVPKRIKKPVRTNAALGLDEVLGVGNLLTRIGRCCKPIPGDNVIGYITLGTGITIHRNDCSNIMNLRPDRRERVVAVDWGRKEAAYNVDIELEAFDRTGLLNDVTNKLVSLNVPIVRIDSSTDVDTQSVLMKLTLQLEDADQLVQILNRLTQIDNVRQVRRAN